MCKLKLNGYTAVEQHKFFYFNCLLFRKWHNIMKCLDSGHDSSLLCGSVLRTRYHIWEAHFHFLSFKKTCSYCFKAALLSGANFQMFVVARGTENHRYHVQTVSVHSFGETADHLPTVEKILFAFLLSLPRFMSHSTIHFAHMQPFNVDVLRFPLLRLHKVKSTCVHAPDRFPALIGCSATGTVVRQCSSLFWVSAYTTFLVYKSSPLVLASLSLFFTRGPGQGPCVCWHWGDFLSDAVTSLLRHCMTGVVHLSLQHKKGKCRPETNPSY